MGNLGNCSVVTRWAKCKLTVQVTMTAVKQSSGLQLKTRAGASSQWAVGEPSAVSQLSAPRRKSSSTLYTQMEASGASAQGLRGSVPLDLQDLAGPSSSSSGSSNKTCFMNALLSGFSINSSSYFVFHSTLQDKADTAADGCTPEADYAQRDLKNYINLSPFFYVLPEVYLNLIFFSFFHFSIC